jgi:hypothetical protein
MAKTRPNDDQNTDRPSDQEGQQGDNIEKMRTMKNRDTPHAPVAGSKDDQEEKSQPDKLAGPLHDEGKRSGTRTDQ